MTVVKNEFGWLWFVRILEFPPRIVIDHDTFIAEREAGGRDVPMKLDVTIGCADSDHGRIGCDLAARDGNGDAALVGCADRCAHASWGARAGVRESGNRCCEDYSSPRHVGSP